MIRRLVLSLCVFWIVPVWVIASPPPPTEDERSFVEFSGTVRSVKIVTEHEYSSWSRQSTGKMPVPLTRVYPKLQVAFSNCKDLGKGYLAYQGFCNNPNFYYYPFCGSQTTYNSEADPEVFLERKVSGVLALMGTEPCISGFKMQLSGNSSAESK